MDAPADLSLDDIKPYLESTLAKSIVLMHWSRFRLVATTFVDQVKDPELLHRLQLVLGFDALWQFLYACKPRRERARPILIPDAWKPEIFMARNVPGQGLCVLRRFIFTVGLCTQVQLDELSCDYRARYCFPDSHDATLTLLTWDGKGDPPGNWLKEKATGRLNPNYVKDA